MASNTKESLIDLSPTTALQVELAFGVLLTIGSCVGVIWILMKMERQNCLIVDTAIPDSMQQPSSASSVASSVGEKKVDELELEEVGSDNEEKPRLYRMQSRALRWPQKAWILAQVAVLTLLNYLLLVFLPSSFVLSLVGAILVWIIVLSRSILDEIRRQRIDRLLWVVTLFLTIASGLSLATYARLRLQEGSIYQGKARIVGYDATTYNNKDGVTLRADLEVAWGGSWGCPDTLNQCQAFVSGALCETEYDANDYMDDAIGNRRKLEDGQAANDGAGEEQENGDANEDLEQENEELEQENEELKEENEELEQDLEEEETYEQEEEEENEELEEDLEDYIYSYEDDYYEDSYWDYDWDSVWGDYACQDLFETDMEGMDYDADTEPGSDEWPFVYIYGSCSSCQAFLVDYYSTEHFQSIENFQRQGINYAIAASVFLIVSAFALVRQRLAPSKEREIELLSHEGGAGAPTALA